MSVTIKDVAKKANVSPATVSRVIADSSSISEKTKKKVRKVMEELGYYSNYNARVLVQKNTQTIGIVMKHSASHTLNNPFFPEVLRGISSLCYKHEYSISLTTGETEEDIYEEVVRMVRSRRVDGVIVLYSKINDKVVPFLLESDFPFVVIGKPLSDTNRIMYVDNDNIQAAKEATEYIITRGHEKIGFIGGDPNFQVVRDRLNGFQQAVNDHHLALDESYEKYFQFNQVQATQIVQAFLRMPKPPTAFVITDDINALLVMLTLRDLNINVPEEISIISFNNTIISKLATPPMTSVDTQTYQLGFESAKCLLELINTPNIFKKSVIIPTIIIERDTCMELVRTRRNGY
ncbi:LacI family transcriptional regulator [Caldibacillus lycopersici]|uniref:LacI family transcriptional regulator n=1 Tax=Perspicuibacillus lycopersici TaxID=1325689 RepID=A0AAE3IVL2_9BACI|nr:LacI family DNA-binding transcriptional regulator [Perspicuibacillus lycopersici]MCU9615032.1 LacI family transcriptional regulator [Perspicuibacillus lycopersici]